MLQKLSDYLFGSYKYHLGEGFGLGCGTMFICGILAFIGNKFSKPLEFVAMLFFWLGLLYIVANPFVVAYVAARDKLRQHLPAKKDVEPAPPRFETPVVVPVVPKVDANSPLEAFTMKETAETAVRAVKALSKEDAKSDDNDVYIRKWDFADDTIQISYTYCGAFTRDSWWDQVNVSTPRGDCAFTAGRHHMSRNGWEEKKFIRGPWLKALYSLDGKINEKEAEDERARQAERDEEEAARLRIERGE